MGPVQKQEMKIELLALEHFAKILENTLDSPSDGI